MALRQRMGRLRRTDQPAQASRARRLSPDPGGAPLGPHHAARCAAWRRGVPRPAPAGGLQRVLAAHRRPRFSLLHRLHGPGRAGGRRPRPGSACPREPGPRRPIAQGRPCRRCARRRARFGRCPHRVTPGARGSHRSRQRPGTQIRRRRTYPPHRVPRPIACTSTTTAPAPRASSATGRTSAGRHRSPWPTARPAPPPSSTSAGCGLLEPAPPR